MMMLTAHHECTTRTEHHKFSSLEDPLPKKTKTNVLNVKCRQNKITENNFVVRFVVDLYIINCT